MFHLLLSALSRVLAVSFAQKLPESDCVAAPALLQAQSRVLASQESQAVDLQCTFVGMMEEDTSIGEENSTDDGYMWGECEDDSGVIHYLLDDDELENFVTGDKVKLTVSEVSGGDLPTDPNFPWQSHNVPLFRIVSVIAHESALLTEEDRLLTDGGTTTKEVDVIMMICNYKDQNAFVSDETRVMNSFYQKLGENLYSTEGSFADMIKASSYGRITAPRSKGKVVTVKINKNFPTNGCPYNDMARDCRQATRDQTSFDADDFTFREYFIPRAGSCRWGGLASVGCGHYSRIPRKKACNAWYRSDIPSVRAHEIGHNLGFLHAGGRKGAQYVEYGDPQAAMGASYRLSSFNAASRYQGGFLRKVAGEAVEFHPDSNAGNSGTFVLQSLSKPLGEPGSDAVAVFWACPKCTPKVSWHARNVGGYLWLQFRGDEGYSDSRLASKFQNKVYVHLARRYTSRYYGKGTEMWEYMGKGDSYRPPSSDVVVTVNDIAGDLATVTIQAGNPVPTTTLATLAPTTQPTTPTTQVTTTTTTQAFYALGSTGSNGCPPGYTPITSDSVCQAAAGSLSLSWSNAKSSSWQGLRPAGCFQHVPNGVVHNNVYAGGVTAGDDKRLCEKAFYALGSTGSNDCPPGYTPITSDSVCQAAAGSLSLTWSNAKSSSWQGLRPAGCFQHVPNGVVHNNVYAGGVTSGDDKRLCEKVDQTTTTTTTTTTTQALYALAPAGSNDCLPGFIPITSDSVCEAAAASLDLKWGSGKSRSWAGIRPAGCFQHVPNGLVHNNVYAGGATSSADKRLCQKVRS